MRLKECPPMVGRSRRRRRRRRGDFASRKPRRRGRERTLPMEPAATATGWGPFARLSERVRIQAAKGTRAAVMEIQPGMWVVTEVPEAALSGDLAVGFLPLLAPLMVNAVNKAVREGRIRLPNPLQQGPHAAHAPPQPHTAHAAHMPRAGHPAHAPQRQPGAYPAPVQPTPPARQLGCAQPSYQTHPQFVHPVPAEAISGACSVHCTCGGHR